MTKHLRLIMLSLLAMICMGGYSAVGDTYKLVTSVADLHDGDVIVIGASQQGYAMGPVNSKTGNNREGKKVDIVDGVLKFADEVAELTLKACADNKWQFHSNEGYLCAAGTASSGNFLRSDGKITDASSIATIVFDGSNATITFGGAAKSKIIRYNHSVNKKTQEIISLFSCYSSGQKDIQIYKKQIEDNRQDAGIHFAKDNYTADITKSTFNGAELLVNPHGLEVAYEITPKSEGVSIALDGTVTYPAVEATYTVTAKFAGNDTYKPATVTYTLNVVDNRQDAGIQFAKDSYTVDITKSTFNGAELVNPHGLEVAYEITPKTEDVRIAQDGTVTYPAVETAYTVTAKFAGNDIYKPATVTYTLNVVDNRQDAGIQFAKDSYTVDITKSTFNGAELVNPHGLEVAYEITPKTEDVRIAQDGTVTYPAVETAYTVTAKFAGNDIYKPATVTYTLNVVDPNAIVFDATVDKGAKTGSGSSDKFVKADQYTTTLYGSNAAFNAKGNAYRFYASSHMQISVTKGIITKIKIEGNDQDYPLGNLKLRPEQPGKITSSSDNEVIWEGSANSVRFSNNATKQARVSKITVTVMPHYTFDETVDNVIEAKENAYVTLKRTFYHDNAWNTLCLPFDVDANKVATAFAGAEIREIDISQCKGNTIQFVPATEIKAGVPYIIKWNENVAEAKPFEETFEGVMLVAEPKPVKVNNDITFTGFYKMTAASELGGTSVAAIGAGSKLFTVGEGKMKGFRAAFVLSSNAQASKYKVVIDGTATGIEDLVIDNVKANARVYNLNGQYVGNNLNGLQPGLYIQNGKKIVVK